MMALFSHRLKTQLKPVQHQLQWIMLRDVRDVELHKSAEMERYSTSNAIAAARVIAHSVIRARI
jgi:hypothetical protein